MKCGGQIVDIFKHKGSAAICDNSRGILLADHMFKVILAQVLTPLMPIYMANMPCNQLGGVAKKSTDFGTHMVRTAIDVAAAMSLCIFILFVDLVKAFDRILRELLFGWPSNMTTTPVEHLMALGVSLEDAEWLVQYIEQNKPLLYQWGVDHKVISLLAGLHAGAWFTYGDFDTVVLCKKGGRQGCQSVPIIFNAVYSIAVKMLLEKLKAAGVVARFKFQMEPSGWEQASMRMMRM